MGRDTGATGSGGRTYSESVGAVNRRRQRQRMTEMLGETANSSQKSSTNSSLAGVIATGLEESRKIEAQKFLMQYGDSTDHRTVLANMMKQSACYDSEVTIQSISQPMSGVDQSSQLANRLAYSHSPIYDSNDDFESVITGSCCCGCGSDASGSHHTCSVTNKNVMAWCYPSSSSSMGYGSCAPCKTCALGGVP